MQLADQYARALFEVTAKNPGSFSQSLRNLQASMKKRGHEKLMPNVFSAYERLEGAQSRRAELKKESPDARRTRMLVELYKKLITS